MKIPDNTKIQSVDLFVSDLDESLNFYSNLLGLKETDSNERVSLLAVAEARDYMIKLTEDKKAPVRLRGTPGLYHIAFKFPNRKELARVFLRLFDNKVKFQGFSDHSVSEAIYLADPDGNGIELYVDRPEETWIWKFGQIQMETLPLDLSVLTKELDDREVWNGIHPKTEIGHIHLNVSDLMKTEKFYNEILGFNMTNRTYPGALFLSAGSYHHHIGANVWQARRGTHLNPNSLGMQKFTIKLYDISFVQEIEARAKQNGLLHKEFDGKKLRIRDFDSIKMDLIS